MRSISWTGGCVLALLALGWGLSGGDQPTDLRADDNAPAATGTAPVEGDMHEFMEYVCEPPYKRLKVALATAPTENSVWKAVKSDSLILAESGNLLIGRPSEKDAADWLKHAMGVRETGGALYKAAKKKDPAEARKQWELMLNQCNACHNQFAGGEHQLTP
jgi:hypothetical protein